MSERNENEWNDKEQQLTNEEVEKDIDKDIEVSEENDYHGDIPYAKKLFLQN
ncbi:hypothetical protein GCM10010912_65420 [Paenibacillus albidus]|uniref:Uncharacterized protein n=1 Tax=Paenibacillus albidus TaxID=2041023 RepID=A0A917D7X1_9BACL|nr:hypothetical protein [Paenibacillus albidus]GGG11919.1 hypothetical protein GCM10010912_65420 [Paenibacillus albidus]